MIYTIFILFTGVYLGQEYNIIPSIRIIFANLMFYLRGLQEPNNVHVPGLLEQIRGYLFW
jgi:hypothetical protein